MLIDTDWSHILMRNGL